MKTDIRGILRHLLAVLLVAAFSTAVDTQELGWVANGRDPQGTRYLPASDITRDNVGRLEAAWTYRTGEADSRFATKKPTAFEATVGGGDAWGTDDHVVAFHLRRD
jgi:glucose dehydrogenase